MRATSAGKVVDVARNEFLRSLEGSPLGGYSDSTMTTPRKVNSKTTARAPSTGFMLVGGPKNMPLMLEQSGVRYATLFLSQKAVDRFLSECCALNSYQSQRIESAAQILTELQRAQKFGCGLLLVDPLGPEINNEATQPLAAFMKKLSNS